MNLWGWIFVAPVLGLLVLEPGLTLATILACAALLAGAIWLFNLLIGPKPPK